MESFGDKNLTEDEINSFHLSTLKLSYEEAVKEYKDRANTKIGKLVANRELPVLYRVKEILRGENSVNNRNNIGNMTYSCHVSYANMHFVKE